MKTQMIGAVKIIDGLFLGDDFASKVNFNERTWNSYFKTKLLQ